MNTGNMLLIQTPSDVVWSGPMSNPRKLCKVLFQRKTQMKLLSPPYQVLWGRPNPPLALRISPVSSSLDLAGDQTWKTRLNIQHRLKGSLLATHTGRGVVKSVALSLIWLFFR